MHLDDYRYDVVADDLTNNLIVAVETRDLSAISDSLDRLSRRLVSTDLGVSPETYGLLVKTMLDWARKLAA
jgi:hypothetical protein